MIPKVFFTEITGVTATRLDIRNCHQRTKYTFYVCVGTDLSLQSRIADRQAAATSCTMELVQFTKKTKNHSLVTNFHSRNCNVQVPSFTLSLPLSCMRFRWSEGWEDGWLSDKG